MSDFDYDLIVIGGGSGGMAAAKEAMVCGAKKVALFDFVKPTSHGTKWGLGGTCVNVGCIPKKLMHYAASIGPVLHGDAGHFGWDVNAVQQYVKKLNFNYKVGLRSKHVEYINALARVEDANTVSYVKNGEIQRLSTRYCLIAVGGRPHVPDDVTGASEYAITSDDLFSWKTPPGKTLVVGASYIALECAGFLTELGYPTSVAVRSILLRGFDRQCSEKVDFSNGVPTEEFDTVLYATGRRPDTKGLNLEAVGVELDSTGHIIATNETSSVPNIFVVGDALSGGLELTPVAIKAGELLVRRLFGNSTQQMDYQFVPTTVFTPFEYGACGMSEESAIEKYGKDNVEVYLYEFPTLEVAAAHREKVESTRINEADVELSPNSLTKLVCVKNEDMRVVGFHFVGLNAGEMTQGYALALRLGARKVDFDDTVGIHPTDAESFHGLTVTKSSGESWIAAGGCGGGKCG